MYLPRPYEKRYIAVPTAQKTVKTAAIVSAILPPSRAPNSAANMNNMLKHPQLSTVLSGTPEQLKSLIKDTENGLFSRFIYYRLNTGLVWKNVFANPTGKSLNTVFEELGQRFAEFYETLMKAHAMKFCLNAAQIVKFNAYFNALQERLFKLYGDPIRASVRRM